MLNCRVYNLINPQAATWHIFPLPRVGNRDRVTQHFIREFQSIVSKERLQEVIAFGFPLVRPRG